MHQTNTFLINREKEKRDMKTDNRSFSITVPACLSSSVHLPASKSICNRALVINALSGGNQQVGNLSDCDDTSVMVNALKWMPEVIDIGAAGTAMRFLTAYLSVTPGEHTLTGTERMKNRPIGVLVEALRMIGADIGYVEKEGFPPLYIRGKQLDGGCLEIEGNVSSQYISALLMIGPVLKNGLTLKLRGTIISRPYIDLTLKMMKEFGALADWMGTDTIRVEAKSYCPIGYWVENDWSAASYWFEMVALSNDPKAKVVMTGLKEDSGQGDAVIRNIFSRLGVVATFTEDASTHEKVLELKKGGKAVDRLEWDFVTCPDLAQTVVVTCVLLGVHFRFSGLQSLKIKETDRIEALKTELKKLGYIVKDEEGRVMTWEGERCDAMPVPAVDTYEDHRMAMSFAPAAVRFPGLIINRPMVVTKSYPHFWEEVFVVGSATGQDGKNECH